jgi:hypothetical protein
LLRRPRQWSAAATSATHAELRGNTLLVDFDLDAAFPLLAPSQLANLTWGPKRHRRPVPVRRYPDALRRPGAQRPERRRPSGHADGATERRQDCGFRLARDRRRALALFPQSSLGVSPRGSGASGNPCKSVPP